MAKVLGLTANRRQNGTHIHLFCPGYINVTLIVLILAANLECLTFTIHNNTHNIVCSKFKALPIIEITYLIHVILVSPGV